MNDDDLREAVDEFMLRRINNHGKNESPAVVEAYMNFERDTRKLKKSLNKQQKELFMDCENSFGILDGETVNFYYRAGFFDAVSFLMCRTN